MRVVRRRERRAQNRERVVSKLNVLARWNRARLEDRRGERFSFVERRGGRPTPLLKNAVLKLKEKKAACMVIDVLEPIVIVALLLVITACLVNGSFNPFLYFRF